MAINTNTFTIKNATLGPLHKAPAGAASATPAKSSDVAVQPTEQFTASVPTSLRAPRPGSDMDQMVQDFRANGMMPQAELVSPETFEAKPLKEARPGSDMAQMVEDLDYHGISETSHVAANKNGTISILDDADFYGEMPGMAMPAHHKTHGHDHGHKHDAFLTTHLGTEVIEQLGHGAHSATHAVAEVTGHAVTSSSSGMSEVVSHAATHGVEHGTELFQEVAETAQQSAVTEAKHVAGSEIAHGGGGAVAHHLSTGLEVALGVGSLASGALAIPLVASGVKELKAGFKEKDYEKIAEGVGHLAVGTRSAAAATVMGGMLTTSEVVTSVAGVAAQVMTPLGLLHAGIDTVLGVKDIVHGKTTDGLLKIGFGVAVGAAALGAGIPATVAAIGFVGAKVGRKIYKGVQEKKAAAIAEETKKQEQALSSQIGSVPEGKASELRPASYALPKPQDHSLFRGSLT